LQLVTVLVHQVIPIIDHLTTELASAVADKDVHMSIHHGVQNATCVVNKYYTLSDDSMMYRVAMSERCFIFSSSSGSLLMIAHSLTPKIQA